MKRVWGIFFLGWVFFFVFFYCSVVFKFSAMVGWMAGKGLGGLWKEGMVAVLKENGISFERSAVLENSIEGKIQFESNILTCRTTYNIQRFNLSVENMPDKTYDTVIWKGGGVREFKAPNIDGDFIIALKAGLNSLAMEIETRPYEEPQPSDLSLENVFDIFKKFVNGLEMREILTTFKDYLRVDFDLCDFHGSPHGMHKCYTVSISDLGGVVIKGHHGAVKILVHGHFGMNPGIYFTNKNCEPVGPAIRGRTAEELQRGLQRTITFSKALCVENELVAGLSVKFNGFVHDGVGGKWFAIYLYGKRFRLRVLVDESGMPLPISYTFALEDDMGESSNGTVTCSDINVGVAEILK
jgi:hypothetical protein